MAKKIAGSLKLQIPAGKANPAPPIGPALGQRGINIPEFCKQFNEKTKGFEVGLPIPVIITYYVDKKFTFELKTPPASVLIRKAAKIEKGSSVPNKTKVGVITKAQLREIALQKAVDLSASTIEAAERSIAGTARSMGVEIQ